MGKTERSRSVNEAGPGIKILDRGLEKTKASIEDLTVLYDFAKEGEATEEEVDKQYEETVKIIEDIELRNMLRKEEDRFGADFENKFRSRRYGESGLGFHVNAYVHSLGRRQQIQSYD